MDVNGDFQPFPMTKGLVHHPIDSQPLRKWLAFFGVPGLFMAKHHPFACQPTSYRSMSKRCFHRISRHWTVDGRKLRGNEKQTVPWWILSREFFRTKKPKVWLFLLGQWLNGLNFLGITYLVGKISRSNFFFQGSLAE